MKHQPTPSTAPYISENLPHAVLASGITRKTLKNGITVLVKEVYPASVVCLSLWARVGSSFERDEIAGISHFVEHMLFKGTKTRAVGQIPQEIHAIGGYINGFTSYECTCYWIVLPSRYFKTALEIQADAILNPLFDSSEIKKESQVIIEEIRMYQDRPESFCFEKLMSMAFNTHRYRRPITGYEEIIARLTPSDIVAFYEKFYSPNNLALVVVGDIKTEKALRVIKSCFGDMTRHDLEADPSPPEPGQKKERRMTCEGDIRSAHMHIGYHTGGIFSGDIFACDLLASILGEGRSSRLHQCLREKKSLVNNICSSILAEKDEGIFLVEATMQEKNTGRAEEQIFNEIDRIKTHGISSHELQKAKNMIESNYVFSQETVEGLCKKLGYYECLGDYTLTDRYIQKLYEVKENEIQEAAIKYLTDVNRSVITYIPRGAAKK